MMFAKSACSCASFSTRASEICLKGEGNIIAVERSLLCFVTEKTTLTTSSFLRYIIKAFYVILLLLLLNVRRGFCKPRRSLVNRKD